MFRGFFFSVITLLLFFFLMVFVPAQAAGDKAEKETKKPITTGDPYVPQEELELFVKAFSKDELLVEAEGWQKLLRAKAIEIAKAEIAVKRQNYEMEKAKEIQEQAHDATEKLKTLEDKAVEAKASGEAEKILETEEAAKDAQETVSGISAMVDEAAEAAEKTAEIREKMNEEAAKELAQTVKAADDAEEALGKVQAAVDSADLDDSTSVKEAAGKAQGATKEAQQANAVVEGKVEKALERVEGSRDKVEALHETEAAMEQLESSKKEAKEGLLLTVNRLREERTLIIDNLKAVLAELASKTDAKDSATQAILNDYNLYVKAVQGIHLDVKDTTSSWIAIKGWVMSEEGGWRFAVNISKFIGILLVAWILAKIVSRLIKRALGFAGNVSNLLSDFLVGSVRWVIMFIGAIMALAALEVSVAPLLAMVGAAGFIIALALQDSLSNFASGIMILFFRPFDMGDFIEAGGVAGNVSTMNLVSTTIRTTDNKKMVVPNNKIWRDVITNATDVRTRRVDMVFGIGYGDDIDKAQEVLEKVVESHPKVLKDPEPKIRLHVLADSSVNFICRPWTRSVDYWDVYWDVTREVKLKFDEAGISIPFPQQDVHLHVENDGKPVVD